MSRETAQIEQQLAEHIRTTYAGGSGAPALDPDDDLLGSGTIDSMGVVELVSYLEASFSVKVGDDEIVPDNFRSVRAMSRLVADKSGLAAEAEPEEDGYAAGVRALVEQCVPADGVVAVVSHGDDALLELGSRTGRHFPRDESGAHQAYNPESGEDAVAQLRAIQAEGATHVVFPETELWWLDEYAGLREHLDASGGEVGRSAAGVVYSLRG